MSVEMLPPLIDPMNDIDPVRAAVDAMNVDETFADIMGHLEAEASVAPQTTRALGETAIEAEVASFADMLADDRFTEEDNAFLTQHGITSRHMTFSELDALAAREAAARKAIAEAAARQEAAAEDAHQMFILDHDSAQLSADDKDKKSKRHKKRLLGRDIDPTDLDLAA